VKLAPYVNVMLGNEEDFTAALGFKSGKGWTSTLQSMDVTHFRRMIEQAVLQFPKF
jgi:2-dehydro-3-deoxygluconokinase